MRKVELQFKIKGEYKTVDVNNRTSFAFNLQADELTNPTATKIPFSINIQLPKTQLNNDMFDHIWRLDHTTNDFNPLLRTDFRLYVNNNLYQTGYVRLEKVGDEYSVRLFGGLGDYFYTLQTKKLKDLDFGTEINHIVNKDQVARSFSNRSVLNVDGKDIKDIINYIMTYQGSYDNFDNGSIDTYVPEGSAGFTKLNASKIEDVKWELNNRQYKNPDLTENERIGTAYMYLKDGVWQSYSELGKKTTGNTPIKQIKELDYIGEYRSYYQKPTIRFKYLFDKAVNAAKDDGWVIDLDPSFFNENNPYWEDTWVILNQYNTGSDDYNQSGGGLVLPEIDPNTGMVKDSTVEYDKSKFGIGYFRPNTMDTFQLQTKLNYILGEAGTSYLIVKYPFRDKVKVDPTKPLTLGGTIPFKILNAARDDGKWSDEHKPVFKQKRYDSRYEDNYALGIRARFAVKLANGKTEYIYLKEEEENKEHMVISKRRGTNKDDTPYSPVIGKPKNQVPAFPNADRRTFYIERERGGDVYTFKGSDSISAQKLNGSDEVEIHLEFLVDGSTYWHRNRSGGWAYKSANRFDIQKNDVKIDLVQYNDDDVKSEGLVEVKDLFRTEKTAFDLVTSYAKMFGLLFIKDVSTKTIKLVTRNTYYSKKEILDWTNKIDIDSININPVPFDYKVGIFKYNDKGCKYELEYKEEFDRHYGSLNFDNGLEFTNNEKNYIANILFDNGIVARDYSKYFLGRSNEMFRDNKNLFHFQDKDKSAIKVDYVLSFRDNDKKEITPYLVTDDTPNMAIDGYCWNDINFTAEQYYVKHTKSINKGGEVYSLNFGRPKVSYSDDEADLTADSSSIGAETIYSRFWKAYINDRFNQNNKVLNARFNLTLDDFKTDLFNKFIMIKDTLWVINKIDKYDPTKDELTNVELVKVNNINNYLAQNYGSFDLLVETDGNLIYHHSKNIGTNPLDYKVGDNDKFKVFDIITNAPNLELVHSDLNVELISKSNENNKFIKYTYKFNIPSSSSVGANNYNTVFRWGDNDFTISIYQVSNWSVEARSNFGTAYIDGVANNKIVPDGSNIKLTSKADGYEFGYWVINDVIYPNKLVNYKVEGNIRADAYWYDPKRYTKLVIEDPYTSIRGVNKIGEFYILEIGKQYEIINSRPNLTGFRFSEDEFTNSFIRVIKDTDKVLNVYYDAILINGKITNKSDNDFEDLDLGVDELKVDEEKLFYKVGNIKDKRYDKQLLTYSNTELEIGINELEIEVHNVGWLGDQIVPLKDTNVYKTKVYSPIEFILEGENIKLDINKGNGDIEVTIELLEARGSVIQKVRDYEYKLELTNADIKPIGWNGEGLKVINLEAKYDQESSIATIFFNQYEYELNNLTQIGDVTVDKNGSKSIMVQLKYGKNKLPLERTVSGSVLINGITYIMNVKQEGAPEEMYNLSIEGDAEASTMTDFKSDTKLEIKVNQAENANYAVQANLAIKANHSSKSNQLMNARKIQVGKQSNEFDGTKDIHYTLKDIGAVPKIDYDNLVDKVEDLANNQGNNKLYVDLLSDQYIQGTKTFDETKIELLDSKFQPTLIIERVNESKFELKYYYNGNVDTPPLIEQTVFKVNNTINVNLYKNDIVWKYIILHNPTNYNNGIFNFTTIRNSVQKYFIFNGNDSKVMRIYHTNGRDHTISAGECQTLMSVPTRFMTPRPDPNKPGYGMLLCSYYDNNWQ